MVASQSLIRDEVYIGHVGNMAASKRLPDWLDEVYIGHVGKMAASKRLPDWLD